MAIGTRRLVFRALGIVGVGGAGLAYSLEKSAVKAGAVQLHPPEHIWPHKSSLLAGHDHASVRRGYEVYKNVCAACHSLTFITYRHMVNVIFTEAEAKAEAAEHMYEDGPNEQGEMFQRPGKVTDKLPKPYPNEEAAKYANNGANPPDLSLITLAREGGEDYVFALLTGYCDPPAGLKLMDGLYYNPYFPDGSIAMARSLYNETIEYSDGTPATASQLAKDVVCFLAWCSDIKYDERKRLGVKVLFMGPIAILLMFYVHRFTFIPVKTMKYVFKPKLRK